MGSLAMSATYPTHLETWTKESDPCASQGHTQKLLWCNKGEVGFTGAPHLHASLQGGILRPLQSTEDVPLAHLTHHTREVEHECTHQDPKDGELCLGRAKPE
jgi:hypothetical protein